MAYIGRMFTAEDIPKIVEVYKEADVDGGGLDMEQFCVTMQKLFGFLDRETLTVLHMQIDINNDKTVDFGKLMDFLISQNTTSHCLDYRSQPFPKPFKVIPVNHYKPTVGVIFREFKSQPHSQSESQVSTTQARNYQSGQYISISSDGVVTFWTDKLEAPNSFQLYKMREKLPYSHKTKIHVNDMLFISDLQQMAFCTNEEEVLFYHFPVHPIVCELSYSLKVKDEVTHMSYWSSDSSGMFSFVDVKGCLYVFTSRDIEENGLFYQGTTVAMSKKRQPKLNVLDLLKNPSPDFFCFKVAVLNGPCRQIRYFPSIKSFAICCKSSQRLVLVHIDKNQTNKIYYEGSNQEFFTCVEFSQMAMQLVTGCTDGFLRVWSLKQNVSCDHVLKGHVRPVTHLMLNSLDNIVLSISDDLNVCVWSKKGWVCRQSFHAYGMGSSPISCAYYSTCNNELILANTNIGACLGRGTGLFQDTLTSHDKPLCSALYHSIYKQVVSVCQNGLVTVWDILTGRAVMEFMVTPQDKVGLTAMSFNGPQRKLITISDNGKVELWNFNDGTQLAVLPVTVPRKVTGIVCLNNRLFVSSRDWDIICDLDMKENEHRYLKHPYLKDIISMDVYNTLLVTASSNGNVLCWDADTGEGLYWLNAKMSPRTQMILEGQTGSISVQKQSFTHNHRFKCTNAQKEIKTKVRKQPLVLCLKTREDNIDTATVLTYSHGYIYAWSLNSKGGLLGKFRGVMDKSAVITTMSTDPKDNILLTGDSGGRICLWNIQEFGFNKKADTGPFEDVRGWRVPLSKPTLLCSWKAHSNEVVSVKCDPTCEYIITAGLDYNVLLWTKTGYRIGIFGRDQWDLKQPLPAVKRKTKVRTKEKMMAATSKSPYIAVKEKIISRTTIPERDNATDLSDIKTKLDDKNRQAKLPPFDPSKITAQYLLQRAGIVKQQSQHTSKHQQMPPIKPPLTKVVKGSNQNFTRFDRSWLKYGSKLDSNSRDTRLLEPQPLPALLTTDHKNGPADMEHSASVVRGRSGDNSKRILLPPISQKFQLTGHQSHLKPHGPQPPVIRDTKQSSPETATPYLKSKYTLPEKQRTVQSSRPIHIPPIAHKDKLTVHQTHVQPHPPHVPIIRGTNHKQSSSETVSPYLNPAKSKYGRVLKFQARDKPKMSVLTPNPPNTLPEKQRTVQSSRPIHIPPIAYKDKLTVHQTHVQPHPPHVPIIRGTNHKQSSSEKLSPLVTSVMSKYKRLLDFQAREKLKMSAPTPNPPNTLPDKQRPVQTARSIRSLPMADKEQLTGHQTNFKPHPPHVPIIRGSNLKQSSPETVSPYLNPAKSKYGPVPNPPTRDKLKMSALTPYPPNTLPDKQRPVQTSRRIRFPPTAEKVRLAHH